MISIPLLKQSCKANAVIWSLITFVTCCILAVVILVLGNLSINNMRDTMSNMLLKLMEKLELIQLMFMIKLNMRLHLMIQQMML